ncbi:MAG: tetratricopeptide repeat protein [Acidobacteriota bacterium]
MCRSHMASRLALSLILISFLSAVPLLAGWEEGVAAYQDGRYDEAVVAFRELVDRSPETAEGHFMLGRSLYRQKQLGAATASLQKAVELAPSNASHSLVLAQVQLTAGKPGDALSSLGRLDPSAVPESMRQGFNGMLAKVAHATDRNRDAAAALQRALTADAKSKSLWMALGQVSNRLGEPEKRFEALSGAFDLDRDDSALGLLAVHVAMTVAQDDANDANRKLDWYRKAAKLGRKLAAGSLSAENLKLIGGAAMGAQDYEAAVTSFEKALASGADDPRLHYDLGRSYIRLERHDDALRQLQAALDKAPEPDLARATQGARGLAYRHLEKFDQAAEAYRLAGDTEQATEMTKYADNRREWAAAKADCVRKRAQIAELRADSDDLKGTAEWQELEREFTAVLTACEPYLREADASS